ncbi:hypothetical protein DIPPA_16426 [Diplonema papillatum]|nr:hypothetical protein DIPPA_16426 [Diplonema papillatum]
MDPEVAKLYVQHSSAGNSTRGNGPVASAQVGLPYPAETHRVVVAHSYSAADSAALHDRHQRAVRSVRGITTPEVARLRDFVHPPSALLPYAKVLSVLTNALPRRTTPADLYTDSKDAWAAPWRALKPLLGSRPMADILSSIGPRDVPPDVIRYMEETLPGEPPLQTLERISFAAAALGEFVHSLFSLCEAHRGVRVFHGGPAKPRRASASSRSGSSAGCASDAGDAARRRAPSAPVPTARSNPRNQPSDGPGPAPRARRAAPRTRSPAASNKPRPAKKPARAAAAAAAAAAAPPEVCAEPKPLPLAPQPSRAVPDASFTKQQQQQQEQEQQHQHRQTQALDPMHLAPSSAPSAQAAQQGAGVGGGAHRSRVVLSPAVPAMPLHAERPPTQQLQQQPPPPQQQRRSVISPPIPAEFRQSSPQQYRDVVARPAPPAAQPPLQPPRARHSPDLSPSSHDGGGFAADVQPSRSGPGPAAERSVFSPVKSAQFPAAAALHQQQQGSRTVAEGRAAHGRGGGVVAWLTSLGLAPYAAVFEENEIDLDAVSLLTDKDLDDMGIPLGPKKKILHARPMA